MLKLLVCLLLIGICHTTLAQNATSVSFKGHKVLDILFKSQDDLHKVLNLGNKFKLDVWNMPHHLNDSFHVHIEPDEFQKFLYEIKNLGLDARIWIEDVEKLIEESKTPMHHVQRRASRVSAFSLNTYHSYNEIVTFMNDIAAARTSQVHATVQSIGDSLEGRKMEMIKLSSPATTSQQKKAIFIDGGIHAREWVAPATVLCFIEELATKPENRHLLDSLDWYFVPVVNPDGYEYSQNTNRLWRKNRRTNSGSSCVGVDLNRNFDFHWNPGNGGSYNPCDDTYSGQQPLSEIESSRLAQFLLDNGHNIEAYLTFHSYGQYWLYPWGYTSALPSDSQDLDDLANIAANAIRGMNSKQFTVGSSTRVLYAAAGGSDDYAKGKGGVKYAYTVELRDTGRHGFVLPESQIQPTCEETWAGVKAFAEALITRENL